VIGHYFSGLGRYRVSTIAFFLGLIVTIAASSMVIPRYGMEEAGIISSLSYIASALFFMVYFSKDAKIKVLQLFPALSDIPWLIKRIKELKEKS
jgi:O-antigen/teichoic acid export membrane protein